MKVEGYTPEGTPVVSGVFKLVGTHGVPLELILATAKNTPLVIDWIDYIKAALADGHNFSTVKSRILAAVGDVYGAGYASKIRERLEKL